MGIINSIYNLKDKEIDEEWEGETFMDDEEIRPILSRYMILHCDKPPKKFNKAKLYNFYANLLDMWHSKKGIQRTAFLQSVASILKANEHRPIDIRDYRTQIKQSTYSRIISFHSNS